MQHRNHSVASLWIRNVSRWILACGPLTLIAASAAADGMTPPSPSPATTPVTLLAQAPATTTVVPPAVAQPAQPQVVYQQPVQEVVYQQPAQPQVVYQQPAQPQAAQPVTYVQQFQQVVQAVAGDPYGFTGWLNATRAAYGLGPVGYDPNLSAWANANNAQQSARGIGHFVMGPARRQNSAMGNYASIGAMWMASPAHRAALLDPTITMIGIAGWGAYWTFNAY